MIAAYQSTIVNARVIGYPVGIRIDDRRRAAIDRFHSDAHTLLEAGTDSHVTAKRVTHHPAADQPNEDKSHAPRKYFGGFSFSKGDHLKK